LAGSESAALFANQFEDFLVAGLVAEGVEVGIVLDPSSGLVIGVWQQTFQQIERGIASLSEIQHGA
jgi:hypothetical protein